MSDVSIHSILVIDDDKDDFDMVSEVIAGINPEISVSFLSGSQDASKVKEQDFDLVLLDINMPANDGFYWLNSMRRNGFEKPIVMYTNSSRPAHISRAYNEGATLYFTKPQTYSRLVDGLQKLLELDWTNPFSIKNSYVDNGKCKSFEA